MGNPKTDWGRVKRLYVTTNTLSLRDLADMLKVNLSTVGRHASSEGWDDGRKRYQDDLQTKLIEATARQQVKSVAEVASELQAEAEEWRSLARSAMSEFVKKDANGISHPDIRQDGQKFQKIAEVWHMASRMVMVLIGLPTERSVVESHKTGLEGASDEDVLAIYEEFKRNGGYVSEDEVAG